MIADKYEFMTREQLKVECRKLRSAIEGVLAEYEDYPDGEFSAIDVCRNVLEDSSENKTP